MVSHAGFTEGVIDRAQLLDIELITLTEAASVDWSRLKPPEACLRSAAELIETEFDDEVLKAFGGSIPQDAEIVCSCGWRYGAPANYARHVFWRKVLSEKREELIRFDDEVTANGTEKKVKVEVQPGEPHRISLQRNDVKAAVTKFSFKAFQTAGSSTVRRANQAVTRSPRVQRFF